MLNNVFKFLENPYATNKLLRFAQLLETKFDKILYI